MPQVDKIDTLQLPSIGAGYPGTIISFSEVHVAAAELDVTWQMAARDGGMQRPDSVDEIKPNIRCMVTTHTTDPKRQHHKFVSYCCSYQLFYHYPFLPIGLQL